jgi:hypothetical protein
MSDDTPSLESQLDSVEHRLGSWGAYKQFFAGLDANGRALELEIYNRSFDSERALLTKEYASHWQKRRELAGLDSLLRRAGR